MTVVAIDHVQLAMPKGGEASAQEFYEGLLGLTRVPKPPRLERRGGCSFENDSVKVHLGVDADTVTMLIEAARRAEAAVKEMLAIANDGSATTDEFRDALGISKSFVGIASAFQISAAALVAGRERHGDGGAEVLASSAGLPRTEARSQVKAAEALREVPAARDLVESGRVSPTNAKRLAEAIDKVGADTVGDDDGLLANAESMRPEQFSREARRWVVAREDDGGESEHRRQRARRHVRLRNADDGMVHLYGEFDAATGQRIGNRLRAEASRMYEADKKAAAGSGSDRRTFAQCMADAPDEPILHLPGITPDAVQPRPEAAAADVPEPPDRHPPCIAHAPDPPPEPLGSRPEPCGARAGPETARAALRDARVGSG